MKLHRLAMLLLLPLAAGAQEKTLSFEYGTNVRNNSWNVPVTARINYADRNFLVKYNPYNKGNGSRNEAAVDIRVPLGFKVLLRNSKEIGKGFGLDFEKDYNGKKLVVDAVKYPHWLYGYGTFTTGPLNVNFGGRHDLKNGKFHPTGYLSWNTEKWHAGAGRSRADMWWANAGYNSKDLGIILMDEFGRGKTNFDSFIAVGNANTRSWYNRNTQQVITHDDIIPKIKPQSFNFPTFLETGDWSFRVRHQKDKNTSSSGLAGRRLRTRHFDYGAGLGVDMKDGKYGLAEEVYCEFRVNGMRYQLSYAYRPRSGESGFLLRAFKIF